MSQKGFVQIAIIVAVVVLAGVGGYFLTAKKLYQQQTPAPVILPPSAITDKSSGDTKREKETLPTTTSSDTQQIPLNMVKDLPGSTSPTAITPPGSDISQSFNSQTTKLTTLKGDEAAFITVSPNGRRFAYLREFVNGKRDNTWIIDEQEVFIPFGTEQPYWSSIGTFNVIAPESHFDSSGKQRPLFINAKEVHDPSWSLAIYSPDEKRVAYGGERLTTFEENKELFLSGIEEGLKDKPECALKIEECKKTILSYYEPMLKKSVARFFFIIDGKKTEEYEETGVGAFSPDSKEFIYAAKKKRWGLYRNGVFIRELPDSVSYGYYSYSFGSGKFASEDLSFRQDVRNSEVPFPPIISPNGDRIAYTRYASRGGIELIVNGKVYDKAPDIQNVIFSSDGSHIAYRVYTQIEISSSGGTITPSISYIAVDGHPISPLRYWNVFKPMFSPNGKDVAFIAMREKGKKFIVINERESESFKELGNFYFSPDGKYVGFGAVDEKNFWWITEKVEQ